MYCYLAKSDFLSQTDSTDKDIVQRFKLHQLFQYAILSLVFDFL